MPNSPAREKLASGTYFKRLRPVPFVKSVVLVVTRRENGRSFFLPRCSLRLIQVDLFFSSAPEVLRYRNGKQQDRK